MSSVPFVLLAGAGLGPWIWEPLKGELPHCFVYDAEGQPLPQRVEGLEAWVRQNFNRPVVLVAHSAGALLALELTGRAPDLVQGVVFLGALLPQHGQSYVSKLPFPQSVIMPLVLRLAGTLPPESVLRASLGTFLTPAQLARLVAEHRQEHPSLFVGRLQSPAHAKKRLYVVLTEDKAVAPALQRQQVQGWSTAEGTTLASGHLPMLTHAQDLARMLADFGQG